VAEGAPPMTASAGLVRCDRLGAYYAADTPSHIFQEYEQRKRRIERDLRDPKLQPLTGVPLDQNRPA
jgi:hypothetical protein